MQQSSIAVYPPIIGDIEARFDFDAIAFDIACIEVYRNWLPRNQAGRKRVGPDKILIVVIENRCIN